MYAYIILLSNLIMHSAKTNRAATQDNQETKPGMKGMLKVVFEYCIWYYTCYYHQY